MSRATRKEEEHFVPGGMSSVCKLGRGAVPRKKPEAFRAADAENTMYRSGGGREKGKGPAGSVGHVEKCPKNNQKPLRATKQIFENQTFASEVSFGHKVEYGLEVESWGRKPG